MRLIPRYLINFDLKKIPLLFTDYLIVGGGVAGLNAGLWASQYGSVLIFSKDKIDVSNTYYAQGGIAAPFFPGDSPELLAKDTLRAGAGISNRQAVKILAKEAYERIKDLISLGVRFDRDGDKYSAGLEAAHSIARILHAKGDATGEEIFRQLYNALTSASNVTIKMEVFVIDLLVRDNRCQGVIAVDKKTKELMAINSKVVILSTGGAGQLYSQTTNPEVATGDGMAMAYRAGCPLVDLEFFQFHPTVLAVDTHPRFLISEAVRGEGAILRNEKGERFMRNYHPAAELAPRDVVSQSIIREMKRTASDKVFLDFTHLDSKYLKVRFPTITKKCQLHNLDISSQLIPVVPAAHYIMGGVKTNLQGETNISSLYACGEVACTGIHGANRLASTSILEGLIFSYRCVQDSKKYLKKSAKMAGKGLALTQFHNLNPPPSFNFASLREKIRRILWEKVGIIRKEEDLREALNFLDEHKKILFYHHNDIGFLELKNMLILSELMTKSALKRKESRGAHYRSDYPQIDNKNWKKHIIWRRK